VEVTAVSWNKVGQNRAGTVGQAFVPAGKALQDHVNVLRAVVLKDEILLGFELLYVADSLVQHLPIPIGQCSAMLKLQHKWGGHDHPPSPEGDLSRLTLSVAMRLERA